MAMKVLVIGAAGRNAGLVVPALKRHGATVKALVQDQGLFTVARQAGADEVVIGDLRDPDSLRAAAKGVEGVFHINPAFAEGEAQMGVAMVAAAKAAGVRKFVFSSVYHPSISRMINHSAKRPVEEAIYESGMQFTILQPAMFMQNLAGAWNTVVQQGAISMPYSKLAKMCYVDYRDVAEAAALALTETTLDYGTFELCSEGMFDRVELAALMSGALGRTIEASESSPELVASGPAVDEDPLQAGLARMNAHYDEYGFPGGNALVLRSILGREPRSLEQYIYELAGPVAVGSGDSR
jgi:uncharacterized protein YbjT (DUF2867 family)